MSLVKILGEKKRLRITESKKTTKGWKFTGYEDDPIVKKKKKEPILANSAGEEVIDQKKANAEWRRHFRTTAKALVFWSWECDDKLDLA